MAGELPHPELARLMLDESGYTAALQAERSAEAAGRLENLTELTRAMEEYDTLGAFLEHVSLVMDNDAARGEPKVTIMTIHAAKGLEFPLVFLAGWEEGVFPSQRALDEGGLASLEEERRLAYVAITRARTRATILHAANRRIYGQWTSSHPEPLRRRTPRRPRRQRNHHERRRIACGARNGASTPTPSPTSAPRQADARQHPRPRLPARRERHLLDPAAARHRSPRLAPSRLGNKGRDDLALGQRVFHGKFGYGQSPSSKATSSKSTSSMPGASACSTASSAWGDDIPAPGAQTVTSQSSGAGNNGK